MYLQSIFVLFSQKQRISSISAKYMIFSVLLQLAKNAADELQIFCELSSSAQEIGEEILDSFQRDLVYLERQISRDLLNGDEFRPGVGHVLELRHPSIPWN